jgi:hypothetical protein
MKGQFSCLPLCLAITPIKSETRFWFFQTRDGTLGWILNIEEVTRKLVARKQVLVKWQKTMGLGRKGLTQAPQEGKLPQTGEVIRMGSLT